MGTCSFVPKLWCLDTFVTIADWSQPHTATWRFSASLSTRHSMLKLRLCCQWLEGLGPRLLLQDPDFFGQRYLNPHMAIHWCIVPPLSLFPEMGWLQLALIIFNSVFNRSVYSIKLRLISRLISRVPCIQTEITMINFVYIVVYFSQLQFLLLLRTTLDTISNG